MKDIKYSMPVTITEGFKIPGTDIILEKGDQILLEMPINFSNIQKHVGKQNEGVAYVVYDTMGFIFNENMDPQQAFIQACENQNFYGDRADIVKGRVQAKLALLSLFNVEVDVHEGF